MAIELTDEQVMATYALENWWHKSEKQVFEISGPAGSGKTTIIKYAMERLGLKNENVMFCAYSGKAASVLTQHGTEGHTIHYVIYDYVDVPARDEKGNIIYRNNGRVKFKKTFVLKDRLPKKIKLIVVDEGSQVDEVLAKGLLSFGIPIVVLGDLNQLQPIFGGNYFLEHPDIILHQVMRQAEGNPIIYLSQCILNYEPLKYGVYGTSAVIKRSELDAYKFTHHDITLTSTNELKDAVNEVFRKDLYQFEDITQPHIGEKIICKKNNWDEFIEGNICLTNGTSGIITDIHKSSLKPTTIDIDFQPDFTKKKFKHIPINRKGLDMSVKDEDIPGMYIQGNYFQYGYASTVFSAQGSQYKSVLYLNDCFKHDRDEKRRLLYTAITRGIENVTVVL